MIHLPMAPVSPEVAGLCDWARSAGDVLAAGPGDPAQDLRRRFAEAGKIGLTGLTVPEEYDGAGLSATSATAITEALGESVADAGFVFSLAAHLYACVAPIAEFGTAEQKSRWLPGLADGSLIGAFAVTEADAGSDIMSMRTSATQHDDGWHIAGTKSMITNAPVADVVLAVVRTGEGRSFFNTSAFVVERGTDGFDAGAPYDKRVLATSLLGDLWFDDCRVAERDMLGSRGSGGAVFSTGMSWERVCLFGLYLGQLRRVLRETADYLEGRTQFGQPIARFQAVSHEIAECAVALESARSLLFRAAAAMDAGATDAGVLGDMAKVTVSRTAVDIGLRCVQLQGGHGVTSSTAVDVLLDALPSRVFSGSNEVQIGNIARSIGAAKPTRAAG